MGQKLTFESNKRMCQGYWYCDGSHFLVICFDRFVIFLNEIKNINLNILENSRFSNYSIPSIRRQEFYWFDLI